MSTRTLRVGISPCPNDTFTFHGLITGAVRARGIELDIDFADVEALNARLARGEYDAAKASFSAALHLSDELVVLRAGSALGFGVGPLLLARAGAPPLAAARILCPGERTTAHLLFQLFHRGEGRVEQTVFSQILPALERAEADYGVCIHEGRFTYARHGLVEVEDLGATWERRTGAPLPLGGILARKDLGTPIQQALDDAIRASLDHARAHPDAALDTMRAHAQELDDDVIRAHVDLYVNAWTRDLGADGVAALEALSRAARAAGLLPDQRPALDVLAARAP
jgi:1,4-dihydroxy-6-naphthoate synthase